jgi:restriction system protein
MTANIPPRDLVACAKWFTPTEIEIVGPQLVLCLGLKTFVALMRAVGIKGAPKMNQAVQSPFEYLGSMIHCFAHTGAFGMNNRGREQVEADRQNLCL